MKRSIALQYNPDTLSRSYQVQGAGGDGGGERAQPFRLKGPAIESIKLDAEIDATNSLEHPDQNANAVAFGIASQLAALENLKSMASDLIDILSLTRRRRKTIAKRRVSQRKLVNSRRTVELQIGS